MIIKHDVDNNNMLLYRYTDYSCLIKTISYDSEVELFRIMALT